MAVFITELHFLTEQYNCDNILNDVLRDRIACGNNDERLQHQLLVESDLTLKKAVDTALAMETTEQNILTLQQTKPHHSAHSLQ